MWNDDATSENDEFRPGSGDQFLGRADIDAVGVLLLKRKMFDRGAAGAGVEIDVVLEGARHLGAEVAALVEVVHEDPADGPRVAHRANGCGTA